MAVFSTRTPSVSLNRKRETIMRCLLSGNDFCGGPEVMRSPGWSVNFIQARQEQTIQGSEWSAEDWTGLASQVESQV